MTGQAHAEHWDLLHEVLADHIKIKSVIYTSHAKDRMEERGIIEKEVRKLLLSNKPHEMFDPYEYPYGEKPFTNTCHVFSVSGEINGQQWVVGVGMEQVRNKAKFHVRTVFPVTEYSRHNKK